jgi:SPX domain protein involved in polyphosphate accumulation
VDVFRRRELKFIIDAPQRQALEEVLRQRMVPDKHGRSTICNLYYDTSDFRLIRHSLERPVYKEKLRLRSYGLATADADVFLEMKKKYKGVVYKRRIPISEPEAFAFMERIAPLPKDSQIGREMAYFRDYYQDLAPRMYISYDREAWYDSNDGGFRVTMDQSIRFRTTDLSLAIPSQGREILPPELSVLEVKAEGGIPMWMTEFLSKHQIRKESFSKYGRAFQQILQEHLEESRGTTYA